MFCPVKEAFFLVKDVNGLALSAKCGITLWQYPTSPRNCLTSFGSLGGGISLTLSISSGKGSILWTKIRWPRCWIYAFKKCVCFLSVSG